MVCSPCVRVHSRSKVVFAGRSSPDTLRDSQLKEPTVVTNRKFAMVLVAAVALGCQKYSAGPQSPVPAAPALSILPPEIVDTTWEWVGFTSPVEQLTIDAASNYTIRFQSDGRLSVRADCNRGMTNYSVSAERGITIQPIALTRAACPPGSLSDRFVKELEQVRIYFTKDGEFFLEKAMDSGTLRFRRKR